MTVSIGSGCHPRWPGWRTGEPGRDDVAVVRAAIWTGGLTAAEHAALAPGVPDGLDRQPDVLVVGGGAVGLATAVACRSAGLGSVVVLEREARLASAASGGNGGAVSPDLHTLTDPAEFVAFGRASLALHREVDATGDRITTVHTTLGDFAPGAVVMATGLVPEPWAAGVVQRRVKGHMLAVAPGPWRLSSVLSSELGGGAPQPGGAIVCGGTFDDGDEGPEVRPEPVAALLAGLHRLLPATRGATVTHAWCCFRPVVEGRQPVIDRLPGTTNGWVSAGHFTTGVMMSAGTGRALAQWIGADRRPAGLETFSLP